MWHIKEKILSFFKRIIFGKGWKEKELKKIGYKPILFTDIEYEPVDGEKKTEIEFHEVDSYEEMDKLYIQAMKINEFKNLSFMFKENINSVKITHENYKKYEIRGYKYDKGFYIFIPYQAFTHIKNASYNFIMVIFKSTRTGFELYKVIKYDFSPYIVKPIVFLKYLINNQEVRNRTDKWLTKELKREAFESNKKKDKVSYSNMKKSASYKKKKNILVEKYDSDYEDYLEAKKKYGLK